uniref:MptD family putative ECF transporter S component n=1 Tax=Clostridium sp. NkU-1 TaxID=1095009 RepID=UPI00325FF54E
MLMGGLHPILWILMPGFIALFTGVPFMLMCSKVQKNGSHPINGSHYRFDLFYNRYVYCCDISHIYSSLRVRRSCTFYQQVS